MQRTATGVIFIVAAMLLTVLASWSCSKANYAGNVESITLGMESTPVNSLIYIAEKKNYFAANGLNVTIKDYPSGLAAVDGVLKNEVNIATAAEFVIVGKALTKESIRTFGTIDKFRHIQLIARKDRAIENISDLKGKRVGAPLKTAAEFYLGRFLDLHGLSIHQVDLVNVNPPQSVDALVNGDVDAVIAWQPNVKAIEDRLGNGTIRWRPQGEQATYCAVISTGQWVTEHPEVVNRFVNSLVQAENYYVSHPDETRTFIQKKLQYDDAYIAAIWPEHHLSVSLDQSLVVAMEDQSRWMINNSLTTEKTIPDFLDYVYVAGLQAARPGSVNIIR